MPIPWRMQLGVFRHILRKKLLGDEKYPLVLMLEPLLACNLECGGCGKIQHPADILRKRLTPEECWQAAEDCGAPIVTITGGEPLLHPDVEYIVAGLIARGKYVHLCTNAILLEKHLSKFKPSDHLIFVVHLDGPENVHDRMVCRPGVYRVAADAIRSAKAQGFAVMTNSTIFQGEDSSQFRAFFDDLMELGVDGMIISPGYAYEKAPEQSAFLKREQTRAWFRETLKDWRKKGWDFNHSPLYLDYLEGKRDYDCTPWGNPLRNVFGWQRPCYLTADGEYAKTYRELLDATDWSRYGKGSGNPKCLDCMTHVGHEPSAVIEAFSGFGRFLRLLADIMTIQSPKRARASRTKTTGPSQPKAHAKSLTTA